MDLGIQEIILIVVIALLVYGGELPGVMRSLGRTVGSIKRAFDTSAREMTEKLDLKIDVTPEEDLPRLVRRAPGLAMGIPAPADLATEDVSETPAATIPADAPQTNSASPATEEERGAPPPSAGTSPSA